MFDKLTKREKVLASLVGALAPLAVVFMTVIWFIQSYNANVATVQGLRREIRTQQDEIDARDRANLRKAYYEHISFPSDTESADVEYQFWLRNMVAAKVKMQFQGLTRADGGEGKFGSETVYRQHGYKLSAKGTLDQLTHFLHEFYQLPMMHRISKINITPRTAGTVGEQRKIRTGQHSFVIAIDVLAMPKAEKERDFADQSALPLPRTLEEFNDKIVLRNIFGPANNTPTVSAKPGSAFPNTDIQFRFTGQDADESDQLSYELVDCDLPGAKLEFEKGSRSGVFKSEGLELGTYEFKVRVKDSGYPVKSSTTDVTLKIVERPNSRPSFVTSSSLEAVSGQAIDLEIEAADKDEADKLVFELLESDFEEGAIEVLDGNKIKFLAPPTKSGSYKFKLQVTDDADESKFAKQQFTIKVIPPAFLVASKTQITGILNSRKGDMCWINIRPTGAFHKLLVGDTFEVDGEQWGIESILVDKSQVWIKQGDKLKLFQINDFLTNPRKEKAIAEPLVATPVSKKE